MYHHGVRTTLNVDDDVLRQPSSVLPSTGSSVGEALSALARAGLRTAKPGAHRNGVPLIPNAERTVTADVVQELLDESP